VSPVERARRAGAKTLVVVAKNVEAASVVAAPYVFAEEVELELADYDGIGETLGPLRVVRAVAANVPQAEQLLATDAGFEVVVLLTRETAAWLSSRPIDSRIVVRQPTYERLTEAGERDADLPAFFAALDRSVPVEGVPACVAGRTPRPQPRILDTTMMRPDGRLEIFRYAKRFIVDGYFVKSLRCKECVHEADCRGLHVNQVRAHGFTWLSPVRDPSEAAAE
jgi:hypothetical protein